MNDERIGKLARQAETDLAAALLLIDLLKELGDERAARMEMELGAFCQWLLQDQTLKNSVRIETRRLEWAICLRRLFWLDIHDAAATVREAQAMLSHRGGEAPAGQADPTPRRDTVPGPPDDRTWEEIRRRRRRRRQMYAVETREQDGGRRLTCPND